MISTANGPRGARPIGIQKENGNGKIREVTAFLFCCVLRVNV